MRRNIALPQLLIPGRKPSRVQLRLRRDGPWKGLVDSAYLGGFTSVEGTHRISLLGTNLPVVEHPGVRFTTAGSGDGRIQFLPKYSWTDTVHGNFSVAWRWRFDGLPAPSSVRAMVAFGAGGATTPLFLARANTSVVECFFDCDSGTQQSISWSHSGLVQVGKWDNWVITFDWNGVATLYHNGVSRGTATITGNLSGTIGAGSNHAAFGAFNNSGSSWIDESSGALDSLYTFSDRLSASQVRMLQEDWYGPVEFRSPVMMAVVSAPPSGAIMNQFQKNNLGADLFNGTLQ